MGLYDELSSLGDDRDRAAADAAEARSRALAARGEVASHIQKMFSHTAPPGLRPRALGSTVTVISASRT